MTRVPLDEQSTVRLVMGFAATIAIPLAVLVGLICFCLMQFGYAFGDFLSNVPFL